MVFHTHTHRYIILLSFCFFGISKNQKTKPTKRITFFVCSIWFSGFLALLCWFSGFPVFWFFFWLFQVTMVVVINLINFNYKNFISFVVLFFLEIKITKTKTNSVEYQQQQQQNLLKINFLIFDFCFLLDFVQQKKAKTKKQIMNFIDR